MEETIRKLEQQMSSTESKISSKPTSKELAQKIVQRLDKELRFHQNELFMETEKFTKLKRKIPKCSSKTTVAGVTILSVGPTGRMDDLDIKPDPNSEKDNSLYFELKRSNDNIEDLERVIETVQKKLVDARRELEKLYS